jgi:Holliday junction resolvase RusA-like endonuclease
MADNTQADSNTKPDDPRQARRLRLCFDVPGDPVGKGRPRFNRKTGRPFTPKKTIDYERRVAWLCAPVRIEGPVRVDVLAVFKRPQKLNAKRHPDGLMPYAGRTDLDNVIKAVLDGLQGRAFINDRQVIDINARARYAERGGTPRTQIEVFALADPPTN